MTKRVSYLAFGLVLLLQSCTTDSCRPPPPSNAKGCGPVSFEVIAPAPADVSGALIVTDTSGSMQGFAQSNSVRLYTVHDLLERSIRNAILQAEKNPTLKRCYLGEEIDCQTQRSLKDMDNPSTYAAKESRLDKFLSRSQEAGKPGEKNKPSEDPLAHHRISVLISDGMQARDTRAGSNTPCLGGADPECMAFLLKQRAEEGYGIWLTLFYLPFKGRHYAERPLDEVLWRKIQIHTTGLRGDSNFQGISFNVKREGTGTGFTSYLYEGVKPMIVMTLSRDINAGRKFTKDFSEAINREGMTQPSNAVYAIELSPLSVRERRVTKIELPKDAPIEGVRPIEGKRQQGLFDYLIECERNATTKLNVSLEDRQGEQVVPDGVQVVYNLVPATTGTLSDGKLTMKPTEKGIEIHMTCQQLREGNYEACLNLQAELSIDLSDKAFWATLSSDNMYEAPERLFGLRDLVQEVLKFSVLRPRVTDRVIFHIERK